MATSGLGHLLVTEGLLTESDRLLIRRASGTNGAAFARGVLAIGLFDEDELAAFLAEKTRWRVADKDLTRESRKDAWGAIDRLLIERLEVLPLRKEGDTLLVAMVDPLDRDTIEQLRFFTGCRIQPVIATLSQIRRGLGKLLSDFKPAKSYLEDFLDNHALSASQKMRLHQLGNRPGGTSKDTPRDSAKSAEAAGTAVAAGEEKTKASSHRAADSAGRAADMSDGELNLRDQSLQDDDLIGPENTEGSEFASFGDEDQLSSPSSSQDKSELILEDESDLSTDLGSGESDLSSDLQFEDTPSVPASGSLDDALVFESDDLDPMMSPEAPIPTPDRSASEATKESPTRTDSLLEDDLLAEDPPLQAEDESIPDLSFVEDAATTDNLLDRDEDLDANAAEEIVSLDNLSETIAQIPTDAKGATEIPANNAENNLSEPVSDDELFDIGALASDFNSIEESISREESKKPPQEAAQSPVPARRTPADTTDPLDAAFDLTQEDSLTAAAEAPADDLPAETATSPDMIEAEAGLSALDQDDITLSDTASTLTEDQPFDAIDDLLEGEPAPQRDHAAQDDDHDPLLEGEARPKATGQGLDDDFLVDPLDDISLGQGDASPNIPSLNRFMLTMSLMTDATETLKKAIPVLIEARLTRGVIIKLRGDGADASIGWGLSNQIIETEPTILNRFVSQPAKDWLENAPHDLITLDSVALAGAMALYAPWIAGGQRQVLSLIAPTSINSELVAFVTGWEVKGPIDPTLQNMVADIFRKIAQHM